MLSVDSIVVPSASAKVEMMGGMMVVQFFEMTVGLRGGKREMKMAASWVVKTV